MALSRTNLKNSRLLNTFFNRQFSSIPPNEKEVSEKDLFGPEKMAEARQSIKQKLKQISKEEVGKPLSKHDPANFEFTRQAKLRDIHQAKFFYPKPLKFLPGKDAITIYEMNTEIYQTANLLDTMVLFTSGYSIYKVCKQFYFLAYGIPGTFSFFQTAIWSFAFVAQVHYLTNTYLRQVYLVSEIELMKNMEEIRIKTVLNHKKSVFSMIRPGKSTGDTIAKISEVSLSEKDNPNSPIMRIIVGNQRFYCHKNASQILDFELLKAVFSEKVNKIETFN